MSLTLDDLNNILNIDISKKIYNCDYIIKITEKQYKKLKIDKYD